MGPTAPCLQEPWAPRRLLLEEIDGGELIDPCECGKAVQEGTRWINITLDDGIIEEVNSGGLNTCTYQL